MISIDDVRVIVTCPGRNFVAVQIFTSDGLVGVGDATLNGRELSVATLLRDHLTPVLLGRDPRRIEDTWQLLFRAPYWRGGPVQMTALAAIDVALWDLAAQRAEVPLYELLGGPCRDAVLAYCHVTVERESALYEALDERISQGWKVLRPNLIPPSGVADRGLLDGETPWDPAQMRQEVAMLHKVREHIGPDVDLLYDVHGRLEPADAIRFAQETEAVRLFFLEDALRPEQHESLRRLRAATSTPLAIGERLHDKWAFAGMLADGAVDFVRADIGHLGGITEARKLAATAESFNARTAWHGPPDLSPIGHCANVHLDLATWNMGVQEAEWLGGPVAEVFRSELEVRDGLVSVGSTPGLGCVIDEKAAHAFPYQPRALPLFRRPDGTVQDW
jgi:mannonate dehydratase